MKRNPVSGSVRSAIIVCHDWTYGPPHALRDYLLKHKISRLLFIGHRNRYIRNNPVTGSYFELYEHGPLVRKHTAKDATLPEFVQYLRDFVLTLYWSVKYAPGSDMFFGAGNLNAFAGLVLRLFGRARKVVYYAIDYVPQRFANRMVNAVYHGIERYASLNADRTWNYSRQIVRDRERYWNYAFLNQIVVPHGVAVRKEVIRQMRYRRYDLVYIGTLYPYQGIEQGIRLVRKLKRTFPKLTLHIIGDGPDGDRLRKLTADLRIKSSVVFHGYVASDADADRIIATSALGLALYERDHPFVTHTEPGKVKRYLGCGVPVAVSGHIPLPGDMVEAGCVISVGDPTVALGGYLSDTARQRRMRKQALTYAVKHTWERVFSDAFQKMTV